MQNLPEELTRLSSKELERELNPTNKYTRKYYWSGNCDSNRQMNIYKLLNKFKNIYSFENLTTKNIAALNPKSLIPLQIKDIEQFKSNTLKNFINTCDSTIFVKYIKKLASDIFSEERVDVIENNYYVQLTIHFPELVITNSVKIFHTMRDIYIKLNLRKVTFVGTRSIANIEFARTTLTDIEVLSQYQFSHILNSTPGTWSNNFCFGSFNSFSDLVDKVKIDLSQLSTFLMSLEGYLTWESIEGTPYRHLTNLGYGTKYQPSNDIRYYNTANSSTNRLFNEIIHKIDNFQYVYNLVDGKYQINLTSESIKYLEEYLTTNYPKWNFFLSEGKSCILNTNYKDNHSTYNGLNSQVVFKGETKKINIIKTLPEEEIIPPKRIHRLILNNLIKDIETIFQQQIINEQLAEVI